MSTSANTPTHTTQSSRTSGTALPLSPHLQELENESIHILREVAGQFDKIGLLFSGGKDSVVVLELARRAFAPGAIPAELIHIDTGHNFPEVLEFRDRTVEKYGVALHVAKLQDWIDRGDLQERADGSRNPLQTVPLVDTIEQRGYDAVLGGARRDEERARAKERIFSVRDSFGGWDPRRQRPELWNIYNGGKLPEENIRVFPISNWTEVDVWQYIAARGLELPEIYFAHQREVVERDGMWLTPGPWGAGSSAAHTSGAHGANAHGATLESPETPAASMTSETPVIRTVRYRTVGDMSCTGAVLSEAETIDEVLAEIAASPLTERGATRADDRISESAMEDRKKEGYF
ncbi:sulfate adenylyltransferase subunit CysD [Corynebacterium propinquum]